MSRSLHHTKILVLVGLATLFIHLGGPRLWDRDEPRNAGCAEEMWSRSDWVVPVFNSELRGHKPVLLYWCMMASQRLPIDRELAARLPSALFGLGTILLTFALGVRLFGARIGETAGVILGTSLMFVVASRAATPDAPLIFFTTLALFLFSRAAFAPPTDPPELPRRSVSQVTTLGWLSAWGIYSAMGLAVLAKGPVGFILPATVIGAFLLWERYAAQQLAIRKRFLRRLKAFLRFAVQPSNVVAVLRAARPTAALTALLVIAAPWYIWVGVRTDGAWLREFLGEHNLGRVVRPMEGHSGGLWFYPVAILVGFFPWSVFAVPMGSYYWRQSGNPPRTRRSTMFLLSWLGIYLLAFSIARTKLPSYITPTYPALALLTARFLATASIPRISLVLWMRASFATLTCVGLAMMVMLPVAAHFLLPGEERLGWLGLVPTVMGLLAWWYWSCHDRVRFYRVLYAGSTVLCTLIFGWLAARVDRHQHSDRLLQRPELRQPHARLAAFGILEPSWVYYAQRSIPWIERHEISHVRSYLDGTGVGYLITTATDAEELRRRFPDELTIIAQAPYFLHRDQLVLLGSRPRALANVDPNSEIPANRRR